ncbi:MAG: NAD(P)-dependent oxidoreductase [Halobacteriota archaeon]|nr:NAD(P)-dependent oxidoreductase [Halobacteriota archaeon]
MGLKGKKVTVFGGSGFIGSHVADFLTENGYDVTIFDIKPSPYLKPNQKMLVGDVLDFEMVEKGVENASIVYNFAGIADIDEAREDPIGTIKRNILGNGYILESIKESNIQRYVFASTVYVYSNSGSFYRDSKTACELYISDYHDKYDIPYAILRYGSIYGPRTNQKDRIYLLTKQALTEKKMTYEGSGEEIREYIHVEDAARCSVEILDGLYANQTIIITGQHPINLKNLMTVINEILGKKVEIEFLNKGSETHYEITPYSFSPRLGRKYFSNHYIDLGQGIIQCMEEIYSSLKEENFKLALTWDE